MRMATRLPQPSYDGSLILDLVAKTSYRGFQIGFLRRIQRRYLLVRSVCASMPRLGRKRGMSPTALGLPGRGWTLGNHVRPMRFHVCSELATGGIWLRWREVASIFFTANQPQMRARIQTDRPSVGCRMTVGATADRIGATGRRGGIRTPPPGTPIQEPEGGKVTGRSGLGRAYVLSVAQTFLSAVSQGFQPALIRLSP